MSMTPTQKLKKISGLNELLKDQNVTNVEIIYNNEFVRPDNRFALLANYPEENLYRIYVDDSFLTMPDRFKMFVIWHECGHIKNYKEKTEQTVLEREIVADNYAVTKVGKKVAIDTLNYLWSQIWLPYPKMGITLPSRLKNLGVNVDNLKLVINCEILTEPQLRKRYLNQR